MLTFMGPEFAARHHERYRKILMREMTLDEAIREHDADCQQLLSPSKGGLPEHGASPEPEAL